MASERDAERPAGQGDPLVHAEQPEAAALSAGVESLTVVLHFDRQLAVVLSDQYADGVGAGVLGDVRERLLQQPVDGGLHLPVHVLLVCGASG